MTSWGFGGVLRNFSTRFLGDDLAGELDPAVSGSSSVPQRSPAVNRPQHHMLRNDALKTKNSGHVHIRSFPEHQPSSTATIPKPTELSPDQLQQSMKQLMRHPKLWTLYKEELASNDHPTQPETVRRVLVDFLERHGHEITPIMTAATSIPPPSSNSIFQGLNMGLEEESTHVSTTRPTSRRTIPSSKVHSSTSSQTSNKDVLQTQMIRLMKYPVLWQQYKEQLSQEETPDDPQTIRRLLVEFWKEHLTEILRLEQQDARPPASSSTGKMPHPRASFARQQSFSLFQALNTDLDGESEHFLSSSSRRKPPDHRRRTSNGPSQFQQPKATQDSTHRQLLILRSSPVLYAKYQERLLMDESEEDTPAADLLTKFLKEHQAELAASEQAEQEAKRQEALEASLLHLETATLAEEESERKFTRQKPRRHPAELSSKTEHLPKMRPDHRQKLMAYRDSLSSRSMRSVHQAMGALAGEVEEVESLSKSIETNGSTQKQEHGEISRRQQMTGYRDSLSSRSKRTVLQAMDALAGEMGESRTLDASAMTSCQHPIPRERSQGNASDEMRSTMASLAAWGKGFTLPNNDNRDSSTSESMDQSFREGWRKVFNFVTHEMESMTSELNESNESMIPSKRSQTTEDLGLAAAIRESSSAGPLHSSMSIRFRLEDEDIDDSILQQAAEIAQRRRLSKDRIQLESIEDQDDDEEEDTSDDSPDESRAYNHQDSDDLGEKTATKGDAKEEIEALGEKDGQETEDIANGETGGAHDDTHDDDSLI